MPTCLNHHADPAIRREVLEDVNVPPAVTSDSFNFMRIKSEATIIISDLPLSWKSNNHNTNDVHSVAGNWGWNNIQQYSPDTYDKNDEFLARHI